MKETAVPPTETEPSSSKTPTSSQKAWHRFDRGMAIRLGALTVGIALAAVAVPQYLKASDHDDGEVDTKGRNLNLTDLFVFRERDQNSNASANNLVFIMNTNPRSLPRQQYYFSTRARYEFNVTRVTNNDATPTGEPDVTLRFEFGNPGGNDQQQIRVTAIRNGRAIGNATGTTTPLRSNPGAAPTLNQVSLGGTNLAVFAGLREDPFFFDVTQFFRVRAGLRNIGPDVGFRGRNTAVDFTQNYNVNAIAVRVPIQFLQGSSDATTFDVWETISVPTAPGKFTQVERLARPVINEGLVVENDNLNTLNRVTPAFEAAALAGQQPAARLAAPIVADATRTLRALGNNPERTGILLGAFLPDVMRIDTTGRSGYGNALNASGSPIRGRLLRDDVFDTTISVLTNGAVTTDNVSYNGTPGNPAQGHSPLVPSFPYLALPN